MDDQGNQATPKKGLSKGIIAIIVAILLIGGSVAAYVAINNPSSDKHKYFLAEKNTYDFLVETLEDRYSSELDWLELAEENPTESTFQLSAEYNGPSMGGSAGMGMDPAEIINNATLTFVTQSDIDDKKLGVNIAANVAGITVDNINFYLTEEQMILGLPFLNELLQLKAEDAGPLLEEAIPEYTNDEEIDFGVFFEAAEGYISEEDKEYFQEEYLEMIYDELTDDDFTSSKEEINVDGNTVETEKIIFHLDEDKVKEILASVFDKLAKDEKVKELLEEQVTSNFLGIADESMIGSEEIDQMLNEFEDAMLTAKEELQNVSIPNGFTSTIWTDDQLIVKREFLIEMGPDANNLVKLSVDGDQVLTDENISFAYDFGVDDGSGQETMTLSGHSTTEGDVVTDSISLAFADVEIAYEANETSDGGEREFERVISLSEPSSGGGSLYWTGNSTYDNDRMNSVHEFSVAADGVDRDLFSLHASIEGKQIKDVEIPDENLKDLGSMTMDEIQLYIQEDAAMQFQQWIMNIMMSAGGDLGF